MSELCEIYNDCRRISQNAGCRAVPQKWIVSGEFFIAERHAGWHTGFEAARTFLVRQLFHTHPMLVEINRLMYTTCSSLSFFRYMEKEAFPIDQQLFHQIQHGESNYARTRASLLAWTYSFLIFSQPNSSNSVCWRGPTVATDRPNTGCF